MEMVALCPGCSTSAERVPGTHWLDVLAPKFGLSTAVKTAKYCTCHQGVIQRTAESLYWSVSFN